MRSMSSSIVLCTFFFSFGVYDLIFSDNFPLQTKGRLLSSSVTGVMLSGGSIWEGRREICVFDLIFVKFTKNSKILLHNSNVGFQ